MIKQLIKANEAVVKGALLAGCQSFFGYPITPASEIAHAAAKYFPALGRTFVQMESEIASIQAVYGAAAAGQRTMTASSSPGMSLKMEGLSYLAGAELPAVIVDVMRAGPGLGNIAPEQSDYNQMVKGGGHGAYRTIVLAPNSAQEMCDLTMLGFDLADKYKNPVIILADGLLGQMMEPVEFPDAVHDIPDKPWALKATKETRENLVTSIYMDPDEMEVRMRRFERKYKKMEQAEVRYEEYRMEDADLITIGFGGVARILRSVVDVSREQGLKVGLLRPISLWPFPYAAIKKFAERDSRFLVVEMNTGQMVDDVRLAVADDARISFYSRVGGNIPGVKEIMQVIHGEIEGPIIPDVEERAKPFCQSKFADYYCKNFRW